MAIREIKIAPDYIRTKPRSGRIFPRSFLSASSLFISKLWSALPWKRRRKWGVRCTAFATCVIISSFQVVCLVYTAQPHKSVAAEVRQPLPSLWQSVIWHVTDTACIISKDFSADEPECNLLKLQLWEGKYYCYPESPLSVSMYKRLMGSGGKFEWSIESAMSTPPLLLGGKAEALSMKVKQRHSQWR